MTTVGVLIGVDQRSPSSLYIVSDSRLSGGEVGEWDFGLKTFASSAFPDVMGFAGHVISASRALQHACRLLDDNRYSLHLVSAEQRWNVIKEAARRLAVSGQAWTLVHGTRENESLKSEFVVRTFAYSGLGDFTEGRYSAPNDGVSKFIHFEGSGRGLGASIQRRLKGLTLEDTSRGAFQAFVEGIGSGDDKHSGGPPQLVGLYRVGNGRRFGLAIGGRLFVDGIEVKASLASTTLEWRNERFERFDVERNARVADAQLHEPLRSRS